MLKFLLDTSTVSSAISVRPDRNVLSRLTQRGHECAIASVVWDELTYGCARLDPGKRKEELEAYLQDVVLQAFPILPYDQAAASWHGVERARLERVGRSGPYVDGQIAAVARVHDLALVTANVRDFTRFKDLKVEDWTRARLKK
ncbi:MAG: type II toxin-antitoxin system VapC family toxin [Polyangiaceae bacterium]